MFYALNKWLSGEKTIDLDHMRGLGKLELPNLSGQGFTLIPSQRIISCIAPFLKDEDGLTFLETFSTIVPTEVQSTTTPTTTTEVKPRTAHSYNIRSRGPAPAF